MKKLFLLFVATLFITSGAYAGTPLNYDLVTATAGSSKKTDNQAYAGLTWTWGELTPSAVIGFSHGRVESDGDTQGANASMSINFLNGIQLGKIKLTYLNGKEDFQGEAGVGYDFLASSFLIPVGINIPHVAAGIDVYSTNITPYIMLHTRDEFDKPRKKASTECRDVGFNQGRFRDATCTPFS